MRSGFDAAMVSVALIDVFLAAISGESGIATVALVGFVRRVVVNADPAVDALVRDAGVEVLVAQVSVVTGVASTGEIVAVSHAVTVNAGTGVARARDGCEDYVILTFVTLFVFADQGERVAYGVVRQSDGIKLPAVIGLFNVEIRLPLTGEGIILGVSNDVPIRFIDLGELIKDDQLGVDGEIEEIVPQVHNGRLVNGLDFIVVAITIRGVSVGIDNIGVATIVVNFRVDDIVVAVGVATIVVDVLDVVVAIGRIVGIIASGQGQCEDHEHDQR